MSLQSYYGDKKYDIQLKNGRSVDGHSNDGLITSGALVFVYDAGTKTLSTIYSDGNRTSLTNPISRSQFASDDGIKFWSASSSHDLFIALDDGSCGRYSSISDKVHTLPIDVDGIDKCMVFPMEANAGGTETDTGLDLPKLCKVHDVALEVVTTDATETVSIGLLESESNGDADGLLVATSVANAGYFQGYAVTVGSNETYVSAARFGALMGPGSAGTDAANDFGQPGGPGHVVSGSNATSITYTPSSSDTFAGYGYVFFKHLR